MKLFYFKNYKDFENNKTDKIENNDKFVKLEITNLEFENFNF